MSAGPETITVRIAPEDLDGLLGISDAPRGVVIFAHGSGSGRLSPRNNQVAAGLRDAGFATLLLDLLRTDEELDSANVFDVGLLASRLVSATRWARSRPELAGMSIGYFGASTGAAAALVAAAKLPHQIAAVVSRGGRPDLAGAALDEVRCPTLLIVGGSDFGVIELNESARDRLRCIKEMVLIPRATHLFEEPGAVDQVVEHAIAWFSHHLPEPSRWPDTAKFSNRSDAGRRLGDALRHLQGSEPVVLALPRGGVPVAFEIAKLLHCPLQLVMVRKIGAPDQPELGLGAVVDGVQPQVVLNDELVQALNPGEQYLHDETQRQLREIERRKALYGISGAGPDLTRRTVIVVDDGIATGGTMKAVLQALQTQPHGRIVLAVPVAPSDTLRELATLADEVVCLMTPDPYYAVGAHYRDFTQTSDAEVVDLLQRATQA
jgi:predicted phosphoribosyltransferase/dienelactone hydrolase